MCLKTNTCHPYYATEDIICYKVVYRKDNKHVTSQFYCFEYRLGRKYKIYRIIETGWLLESLKPFRDGETINYYVNKGYHSYATPEIAKDVNRCQCSLVVVRCIIPKGSLFFKSIDNEQYCSNCIKIMEVIR